VRLVYFSDVIEACVSLGDEDELHISSTCNMAALGLHLEDHLSLPPNDKCNFGPGCLGLTNLNWLFRDAYLTCISETESCRDVRNTRILTSSKSKCC
jgi:hypothetical protein